MNWHYHHRRCSTKSGPLESRSYRGHRVALHLPVLKTHTSRHCICFTFQNLALVARWPHGTQQASLKVYTISSPQGYGTPSLNFVPIHLGTKPGMITSKIRHSNLHVTGCSYYFCGHYSQRKFRVEKHLCFFECYCSDRIVYDLTVPTTTS